MSEKTKISVRTNFEEEGEQNQILAVSSAAFKNGRAVV